MYLRIFLFFKFLLLDHTVTIFNLWFRKKKRKHIYKHIKKLFIINIIKYKIYAVYI